MDFFKSLAVLVLFLCSCISVQAQKTPLFINKISIPGNTSVKTDELRVHLVDIIFDTNKYELSLNSAKSNKESFGNGKFKESLLDLEIALDKKNIIINTSINERKEQLKVSKRTKKRNVLVEVRMLLYKVILDKETYLDKEKSLRSSSIKRVNQLLAMNKPKRVKKRKKVRTKPRKIIAKKKKIITKPITTKPIAIAKKPKEKVVKQSQVAKVKTLSSRKNLIKSRKVKNKKAEKKISSTFNWPKLYFSAGLIFGHKISDLMPNSQSQPLLEGALGIHYIQYGWKLYGAVSKMSEFNGIEKTVTQSNFNLFFTKDLYSFSSLPLDIENLIDNTRAPGNLGLLLGYNQIIFEGKLVTDTNPITALTFGGYISAMGLLNFELRYMQSISDIPTEASSTGNFSSIMFKLTVGYPM